MLEAFWPRFLTFYLNSKFIFLFVAISFLNYLGNVDVSGERKNKLTIMSEIMVVGIQLHGSMNGCIKAHPIFTRIIYNIHPRKWCIEFVNFIFAYLKRRLFSVFIFELWLQLASLSPYSKSITSLRISFDYSVFLVMNKIYMLVLSRNIYLHKSKNRHFVLAYIVPFRDVFWKCWRHNFFYSVLRYDFTLNL